CPRAFTLARGEEIRRRSQTRKEKRSGGRPRDETENDEQNPHSDRLRDLVSDHVFNVSEDEYHQRTAMGRWVIDGSGIRPIGWRSGSVRPKVVGDGPVDPLGKPTVQHNSFSNRDEDPDGDEDQDS